MTRYAAATLSRPHPRMGYVVAGHVVARTDFDAQGRPTAVAVGERRYASRRTAETVADLIHTALFRAELCGGRQHPITP